MRTVRDSGGRQNTLPDRQTEGITPVFQRDGHL